MSQANHSIYKGHLLLKPNEYRIVILLRCITNENKEKAKSHFEYCNNNIKYCKCIPK